MVFLVANKCDVSKDGNLKEGNLGGSLLAPSVPNLQSNHGLSILTLL